MSQEVKQNESQPDFIISGVLVSLIMLLLLVI